MAEIDGSLIREYLDVYTETQGVLPERIAEFGEAYRQQEYLTREQLYEIAYESSTRSAYHVETNPKARCEEVTANVRRVDGDFSSSPASVGSRPQPPPVCSPHSIRTDTR